MASKFYAVRMGKKPGIYSTWDACKKQVDGFSGASYKSFTTLKEAESFMGFDQDPKEIKEAEMIAYVDGSYNIHTKAFSYGMIVLYQGEEYRFAEKIEDKELALMRNVAGEIMGAEAAMRYAILKGCKSIEIHHDYEGISKWCLGEWKTNKDGTKAYKAYYDSIKDQLSVKFIKVKGHSGDTYNDIADELAKSAIF